MAFKSKAFSYKGIGLVCLLMLGLSCQYNEPTESNDNFTISSNAALKLIQSHHRKDVTLHDVSIPNDSASGIKTVISPNIPSVKPVFLIGGTKISELIPIRHRQISVSAISCEEIASIYVTELENSYPSPTDFDIPCIQEGDKEDYPKMSYTITPNEGNKTLFIWYRDFNGHINTLSNRVKVDLVLDLTPPLLEIWPKEMQFKKAVKVNAHTSPDAKIYYTIDGSIPSLESDQFLDELSLVQNTIIKFIAIDSAGNRSILIERNYKIDISAFSPYSIVIAENSGYTSNKKGVLISAIGKDLNQIMLSENKDFKLTQWKKITKELFYSFQTDQDGYVKDGLKTIYALIKDNAGNIIGEDGSISTEIILDTQRPSSKLVSLNSPPSPIASLQPTLSWNDLTHTEKSIYEIRIFKDEDMKGEFIRRGTTSYLHWQVTPPLDPADEGTYYWQVTLLDNANNRSVPIKSDRDKSFTIKLLSNLYVNKDSYSGFDESTLNYGRNILFLNNKLAINTLKTNHEECSNCSIIEIVDPQTKTVEATLTEKLNFLDNYGFKMDLCDLDDDGNDDLVVSAPHKSYTKLEEGAPRLYANAGAVFAYSGVPPYQKILEFEEDPTINVPKGEFWCKEEYPPNANHEGCKEFGWKASPNLSTNESYIWHDRKFAGYSLACQRLEGADNLLIGIPGWTNIQNQTVGKVIQLRNSSLASSGRDSYQVLSTLEGENNMDAFGTSLASLDKFTLKLENKPTPFLESAIVIGAYQYDNEYTDAGRVYFYNPSNLNSPAATIDGQADYDGYGRSLFSLGNLNPGKNNSDDSDGFIELAVRAKNTIYIYNGNSRQHNSPTLLKVINRVTGNNYGFGYDITPIGDFNNDGYFDLAISDPDKKHSSHQGSGLVYIYDYSKLDSKESYEIDPPHFTTLTGNPNTNGRFGYKMVMGLNNTFFISAPGYSPSSHEQYGKIFSYRASEISHTPPTLIKGITKGQKLGSSILLGDDFDNDGTKDLIISSPTAHHNYESMGRIDVLSGKNYQYLHSIHGSKEQQQLGTDLFYFNNSLYISSGGSSVYIFPKNHLLTISNPDATKYHSYSNSFGKAYLFLDDIKKIPSPTPILLTSPVKLDTQLGDDYRFIIHTTAQVKLYGNSPKGIAAVYSALTRSNDHPRNETLENCHLDSHKVDSQCHCVIYGPPDESLFGYAATFIPDFNGDGIPDLAVGAPYFDNGQTGNTMNPKGAVFIYDGQACQKQANLAWNSESLIKQFTAVNVLEEGFADSGFGSNLMSVTNLNGKAGFSSFLLISNQNKQHLFPKSRSQVFILSNDLRSAHIELNGSTLYLKETGEEGNSYQLTLHYQDKMDCNKNGNLFTLDLLQGSTNEDLNTLIQQDPDCSPFLRLKVKEFGKSQPLLKEVSFKGGRDSTERFLQTFIDEPKGSNFGTTIRPVGDLDGDSIIDIAISSPKGTGLLSKGSGNLSIFSGQKLITSNDSQKALIFQIYSPISAFSGFGEDILFEDVEGDGRKELLITAPNFSSDEQTSLGGVFIYNWQ